MSVTARSAALVSAQAPAMPQEALPRGLSQAALEEGLL
jgi:hypothetical protein